VRNVHRGAPSRENDAKAKARLTPELRRLNEMLHEHASIGRDDSLRRSVVWVRGNLDVGKANRSGLGKYEAQRSLGITEALLPWHDPIANMSKTVSGSSRRSPVAT
jgi:hypothetical protein